MNTNTTTTVQYQQHTEYRAPGALEWVECGDGTDYQSEPFPTLTLAEAQANFARYDPARNRLKSIGTYRIVTTAFDDDDGTHTIVDAIEIDPESFYTYEVEPSHLAGDSYRD